MPRKNAELCDCQIKRIPAAIYSAARVRAVREGKTIRGIVIEALTKYGTRAAEADVKEGQP